ncbi:hypothetical protein LCGC14_2862940 [marine sediment metagenome]|uniref:HTH cro/C1-type domain-containing protein n=1 Tax=marine sediment metagenome TaxID=412755 RepID=A0A0F9ADG9_9ZZZZ
MGYIDDMGTNISDQLREAIANTGQSLRAIARAAGTHHGQLARFMAGDREIRTGTVDKLAEYLGVRLTKPRRRERFRTNGGPGQW